MSLTAYLDKGASIGPDAACLTCGDRTMTYAEVQRHSRRVAGALARSGVLPGDPVAVLSGNDPTAFASVFGIARAGAVWCPVNPRNEAGENRELLDLFGCTALLYQRSYAPLVAAIRDSLPRLATLVCLDGEGDRDDPSLADWLEGAPDGDDTWAADAEPPGGLVMLVGTGGTTGRPKGVRLTDRNVETMSALTLMSYPFDGRPTYLALAPLTHAAGVLCFPVMALGGEIVVMPAPDLGEFLALTQRHRVTHAFLPPTLVYMLLDHPDLEGTDLSSLQCLWYGAAPMSPHRLEEAIRRIGPVLGQLFGQSEAPMMISTMSPAEHLHPDGTPARERFSSAGRPTPLTTVAVMDDEGRLLPAGERGEIVVRGSLVMDGYHRAPAATAESSRFGWHHTGDVGYLDEEGWLYLVDRAKDMIISGGFNVYSAEVEQALMAHPGVQDCAVVGLPDEKWGERVVAVVQARVGAALDPADVRAFARARVGGVKAPKEVLVWPDLPRSKVGKVLKPDIRARLVLADGT
ncbi:long-chain fatty acid--CoA ligase [Geodermatophilus aquaeductus]|uniref:Acyl-CoA synthetase (AMP-forming)/AMP-acid ligase II n=1 Tax=Geodermatophilus aquaeductus TaxID=1564161 RepID=A0A521E340_9ACTN|nr:AMP-binding protein [Geodermatophilus aquaeductus]SMO78369.1 Acyl-CoA synthetase (AMP-forming)/AMP-acid ligase II [Geodermatophilus aquaeductus]